MKGQSKRFVDHKGEAYETHTNKDEEEVKTDEDEDIGFLDLWRYATPGEKAMTALGVLVSLSCSLGVLAAVIIYGELTALFVQRHRAESTPAAFILPLFGGARQLPEGNRSLHMDALVEDSVSFALASLAVMALQLAAASGAVTLANAAANRMVRRLRWQLLRAVLSQEIAFFDTNTTVNFATALTEDMEKFRAGVGEHVVMTSYLGGTVAFGAGLSLAYGWELTLVGLAVVPIAIFVAVTVAKYQTRCSAKEMSAYSAAGSVVEETLSAIRTVRAYGGEELEVQRYAQALGAAGLAARRRGAWAGLGAGLGWLLTYCINASVLAYGAVLCVRDMALPPADQLYHPGVLVTVLFMTFMAAQNIAMCHPHLEVLSAARGAARALYAVLRRRPRLRSPTPSPTAPAAFRGDIVFDNLYFNYPSRPDVKVLRGLSLRVKAGETVALVGSSGCGKSTLLQLLQRLYDPDSGTVSIDGYPLEELNLHHYRTSIGVVGQEPVLFSGTIRENITIGVDDVTEEEMIAAAKTAYAHQFITKLADGYDTVLGEHGAQLSGGQKQRVAIARAVLRRPAVLLLDEPTSALDPAAERQVQAALDAASRGRTTLVVSHRLSTIVNASRIVYMEHGAALEQGTHTELLALRGLYWQLVQEDMTNRSVAALSAAPIAEEDDVVPRSDPREHLQRSFSRQSNCSVSLTRDSVIRGSARHGSVSSAHANIGTSHLINHQEPVDPPEAETEEQSQVPAVSTMELLRLNAKEWPLLAGGGAASFLVGATMPVFALLFSKIYGMFASSDGAEILAQSQLYAALFAGVAALCGAVTFLQTFLFNRAGASLTDRLRQLTFRNYLRQDQGWFDDQQNSVGALCARLATDCAAVQGATGTPLGTILQSVSTVVIGVGLAMPYSWKMTLVSLVSVPCVMGGIYLEGWVTRRCSRLAARALEAAAGRAGEAVRAVRTVQSLGVEATMLARYGAALDAAERATLGARWGRGAAYGVCLCAPTLGYAVSLAYGGLLVAREGLPYEHAILVSEALIYGAWMLAEALSFAPSFAAARRAGARIVQALALQPRVYSDPSARCEPDWSPKGELDFSDISFRYPTRPDTQILRGLQLHLEAGKTVALVGASGCGKSTVMHLLMRSYDPESGTVSLDGRDIRRSLPLAALRGALGVVQQEPALFARSVRDNIAYGDPARRVPTDEVVLAAKQANVHNFIASLPLGYDTPLGGAGGGGGALSGGQRQRIAIARALVRRPRVLLLDEATSALDASSEKSVQAALEAASRGRSTLTIAHRLATVRHAHTIAVIDKGVVAESGSHEELVERRGLYWELLRQQGAQPAQ